MQFAHHNYTAQAGLFKAPVPTRVLFGKGKVWGLRDELEELGGKRVLVLSGKTAAQKTRTVTLLQRVLGDCCVGVYSGLTSRAPLGSAVEATRLALSVGADTLVGVGGSTIPDASRMIGYMTTAGITDMNRLRELAHEHHGLIRPDLTGKALPLQISVPTTLSAGEYNMGGGKILDGESRHFIHVRHPQIYPALIVLDPDMTVGVPDWLWFSSGIKAMDHCVERLYTKGHQPMIDAPILMGAEFLFRYLSLSGEAHQDPDARLQCQIAAWLSMAGVPNNAMGLSHALGHIMGPYYSLNHGYTSCVTLPWVMEFNRPAALDKLAMLARSAGVYTRGMSDEAAAVAAEQAVRDLIVRIGMPNRLRDLNVPREDIPVLAEMTLQDGGCEYNAVPVKDSAQIASILEKAW
jgi:alcohol dehydrogenase class IV